MLIQRLRESGYLLKPEPPRPSLFRVVWRRIRLALAFPVDAA